MPTSNVIPPQGIVIELGFTETSFSDVVAKVNTLSSQVEALREQVENGDGGGGNPQPGQLTITGTPTTSGTVGTAYAGFTPVTAGGTPPRVVSVQSGPLPPGITLSNGSLGGTPTTAGTYSDIVLRVTDGAGAHADLAPFSITVATSGGGNAPDTRPGWFAALSNANSSGTSGLITGRTRLGSSVNGGKTGTATLTTTGSDFAWFAVASASVPTFRNDDSGLAGGFSAQGTFTDTNGTVWRLYRSTYPGTYTAAGVTLS